jgi:predicted O-linked N-acetylglucosamine transferase (SPINDLY family)
MADLVASAAQMLRAALAHHQAGQLAQAEELYSRALEADPGNVDALHLLGLVANQTGARERALGLIDKALHLQPANTLVLSSRGSVLRDLGRLAEAEQSYRKLIALKPAAAMAHASLGHVLQDLGRLEEGAGSYRRALELQPDLVEAHNNLGTALQDLGRSAEAESCYRQAIALKPKHAGAHNNLGTALKGLGRFEEAERCYRHALALKPGFVDALMNLGSVLQSVGRLEEAEQSFRAVLAVDPESAIAHSSVIFIMDLIERYDVREQQAERRRWYLQHGRKHESTIRGHENAPYPERKLRVGYVSADFRRHSAYYAFGGVIRRHDRSAFEVFCYSGVPREDEVTRRLRQAADEWRDVLTVQDEALAEQIRRDGIDILVDLSGHSAGSRLLVFARKPAPVQVTAWGYATGTGLPTIAYFLADSVVIPAEQRVYYAEEIVDLPCIMSYEPPEYMPEPGPLPSLDGKPFTFGCLNRLEKVSGKVMALWGRILKAMPQAQLLLKDPALEDAAARESVLRRLAEVGVAPERVRVMGHSPHVEHLKIFRQVDVALDPFPHGGGVSTAEALYMGVPVVTLQGSTVASRLSASILSAVQMDAWIAHSADEYAEIALRMSRGAPALARLRETLRERLSQSAFGDLHRYTAAVEQAYRMMWRRWCAQPRPA